jgi:hypothetical protein
MQSFANNKLTTVSITTDTLGDLGKTQKGKNNYK